jgi:ABC-type maltose transport system permease subunit
MVLLYNIKLSHYMQNNTLIREQQKAHYFRGFRACLILIVAPILIVFVAFCHFIINNLA